MRRWLAALAVLVAACTGTPDATAPPPAPPSPAGPRVDVRTGGTVTVAVWREPSSLMPYTAAGSSPPARPVYRATLPRLADLAAHIDEGERGAGGEVTVTVRADAVWSDGVPVSAADVAFTWALVTDPSFPAWSRTGFDRIAAVEADGHIAVVRFSAPFPGWLDLFDPVLPSHRLAGGLWDGAPDVAGGPFQVAEWEPGVHITLARNDRWWGAPAQLDRVVLLLVPDGTTQRHMLEAGRVDVVAPPIDTRNGPLLAAAATVTGTATGVAAVAVVNLRGQPDDGVRESILAAVPGADVAESILKDEATPVAPPALVSRGLTGTAVTISYAEEQAPLSLLARAAQRRLQADGARVDLRAREWMRFWDEWWVPADIDVALVELHGDELPWCWITVVDECGVTGWSDPRALHGDPFGSAVAGRVVVPLWEGVERLAHRPDLVGVRLGTGSGALGEYLHEWGYVARTG